MTETIIPYRFLVRGGTAAAVAALNEVVKARELEFETDTRKFKIGDGVTHYNDLGYVGELAHLTDPGGDTLVFWNSTIGAFDWLEVGANLAISGTVPTLDASGGGGSGIPSGTSNPGSPSTNDLYYRTDLALLIVYDGTRWLTVQEYAQATGWQIGAIPNTSANTLAFYSPVRSDFGLYLTRWACVTFVTTTNTGSAFWTVKLQRINSADTAADVSSFTTGSGPDSANTWTRHDQAINAVLDASAFQLRAVNAVKTGSPGSIYISSTYFYRLVVT